MRKGIAVTIMITLLVVIIGGFIGYKALSKKVEVPVEKKEGIPALYDPINVKDVSGNDVQLTFEGNEKPVFINFFATWCDFCVDELPYIQKAYERYGDRIDFMIVDLTDGSEETVQKVEEFMEENGYTFPVYYDIYYEGMETFGATSIPLTVCIDREGYEAFKSKGELTEDKIDSLMEMLTE